MNIPDKPIPVITSAPYKEGGHLELARLEKLERLQQERLLRKSIGSQESGSDISAKPVSEINSGHN